MCYPYVAKFKRGNGTGGVFEVGKGAFKVEKPPFDMDLIKPVDYYYPPEELVEQMIKASRKGC